MLIECSRCGEQKPSDQFHRSYQRKNGFCNYCISCKALHATWKDTKRVEKHLAFMGLTQPAFDF